MCPTKSNVPEETCLPPQAQTNQMTGGRLPVRFDAIEACRWLCAADARLASLMEEVGPFTLRLKSSHSPFQALVESILFQQLNGRAAASILARLLENFEGRRPLPEKMLALSDATMRAAGLSRNKTLALRDLAQKTLDGTVPTLAQIRRMPDEEIVTRLTEVRGVGRWTVEMLLIFRLGRPDVLPITDYGVRKGFLLTFGRPPKKSPITAAMLPSAGEMTRRGERWKPWRSVASWYLWRACDLDRTRRH